MTVSWGHGAIAGATVRVTLDRVAIVPSVADILLGESASFAALAYYSDGAVVNVTRKGKWSTDNKNVATVNAFGVVKTRGTGSAHLLFAYQNASAAALVVVPVVVEPGASGNNNWYYVVAALAARS